MTCLSVHSVEHPGAQPFVQRNRKRLMLAAGQNSPEFGVATADGNNPETKTAQRLNHVSARQLTQFRHNISGFSMINCSLG